MYQQLIPLFEGYAASVFDAYAEELIGVFPEKDEYLRVLREEVKAKIAHRIWPTGPDSSLQWVEATNYIRGVNEPGEYELPPSGLWERVLAACWLTLSPQQFPPIDSEEWKWSVVYLLRYSDIRYDFPHHLGTRLEHQVPTWEAGFDAHRLNRAPSPEDKTSPQRGLPSAVIAAFLAEKGWTQSRLAGEAQIARNTLKRIIKGQNTRSQSIAAVAKVLDCDYQRLLPRKRRQS